MSDTDVPSNMFPELRATLCPLMSSINCRGFSSEYSSATSDHYGSAGDSTAVVERDVACTRSRLGALAKAIHAEREALVNSWVDSLYSSQAVHEERLSSKDSKMSSAALRRYFDPDCSVSTDGLPDATFTLTFNEKPAHKSNKKDPPISPPTLRRFQKRQGLFRIDTKFKAKVGDGQSWEVSAVGPALISLTPRKGALDDIEENGPYSVNKDPIMYHRWRLGSAAPDQTGME